ncbi:hypothetical protein BJY17_000776 [Agromyces hippuratus]|uniref:Uncharacterized protein n=1 Tax=Agromyces hippuratus TaxID=286438 RepID=A0A852WPX3_9MICO|nr:hypothetical protein [Agromyces hippuratus]NYG20029.1 hypothetical protein [Agromyces hippuratus]
MDEEDFEKERPEASDAAGFDSATDSKNTAVAHPVDDYRERFAALRRRVNSDPSHTLGAHREAADRPGIVWVRASDLLSSSSGRLAGRGLDFETELARRLRRAPATARHALRERADRLPPLSAFGRSGEHPHLNRDGLGRR